jgi:hypothetical protein
MASMGSDAALLHLLLLMLSSAYEGIMVGVMRAGQSSSTMDGWTRAMLGESRGCPNGRLLAASLR